MKTYFLFNGLLFAAVCGLLAGCDKKTEEAPCDCPELGIERNEYGFYTHTKVARFLYARPYFNPANPREIVYSKNDEQDLAVRGIWKANLDTRQQTQVRQGGDTYLQKRWSTRDWLALSKDDQVWKIKSNGDSLTQLTFGKRHYQPQWSPDGQRLVCYEDGSTTAEQGLVFLSSKGGPTTAPGAPLRGYAEAWSPDGQKLLVSHWEGQSFGLGVYSFATGRIEQIIPVDLKAGHGGINGADWLPDSRGFVWSSSLGLFKTDLATGRTVTLHTGCGTRTYVNPSVSSDGRTLVVERQNQRLEEDGKTVFIEINLWTMDLDGNNQRKVEF